MILPRIQTISNQKVTQDRFGGINHTSAAVNGELYDMKNLYSGEYPYMATRKARKTEQSVTTPHGLFVADALFLVDGTTLYVDGVSKGTLSNTDKVFAALGERVVIFPDKKIYQNGALSDLESKWSGSSLSFKNGTYAGESAEANTIFASDVEWSTYFNVGDAVTISGCTIQPENNKTPIIREIDGNELRFYEGAFTLPEGQTSYTETGTLKVERLVPDLDYICSNDNRIWGCKGDSIWSCKLGDPTNWNVFDGVATDAYSVDSGTAGDFTGCISYLGYPVFFKDDKIFKVYGNTPQNYQLIASATLGVEDHRSFAVAGETLFYLSRSGICAYSGGIPKVISQPLGYESFDGAVGGSDGLKYYVCLTRGENKTLYCYDTQKGMWHKEDNLDVRYMAFSDGVKALTDNSLLTIGDISNGDEAEIVSEAEFGDFDWQTFDRKHALRLRMRMELVGFADIFIKHDSAPWMKVQTLTRQDKQTVVVALPIKRCDHYGIKIVCKGSFILYGMETEYAYGGIR